MKKITLISSLALCVIGSAKAQVYYNFVQSQDTYSQLGSNAIELPYYAPDPRFHLYTLPKPVGVFGQIMDSSLTIGSGFIITTTSQYSFAIDPFLAQLADTTGGIYVEWDTLGTEEKLWVEWRDFALEGNPSGDFVNFKIGFNLSNEVIEFHYGPSQVSDTVAFYNANSGPQVVITLLTPNFGQSYFFNVLEGNPANPTHHTSPMGTYLSSAPASGTIYRFEPVNISIDEEQNAFSVYPNPVDDILKIKGMDEGSISIIGLDGKKVIEKEFQNSRVDVTELPQGTYMIILRDAQGKAETKLEIVKQ